MHPTYASNRLEKRELVFIIALTIAFLFSGQYRLPDIDIHCEGLLSHRLTACDRFIDFDLSLSCVDVCCPLQAFFNWRPLWPLLLIFTAPSSMLIWTRYSPSLRFWPTWYTSPGYVSYNRVDQILIRLGETLYQHDNSMWLMVMVMLPTSISTSTAKRETVVKGQGWPERHRKTEHADSPNCGLSCVRWRSLSLSLITFGYRTGIITLSVIV